jgi:hypothetical protein
MDMTKYMTDKTTQLDKKEIELYCALLNFDCGDTGRELGERLLQTYDFASVAMLWTRMMRYFHTDRDVEQDFLIKFTEEMNREKNPERQKCVKGNFKIMLDIIKLSKTHLFATDPAYFHKDGDIYCFGYELPKPNKPLVSILIVKDEYTGERVKFQVRDFVLEEQEAIKQKELDRIAEQELLKALEDAKPVKVSQQQKTKSANKKKEQEKREREEFERRVAEAEAERIRQQRKKQQQKQTKRKA